MEWRDLWEKWWPSKKGERTGIPLTDQQRKLTSYLLILVVGAALVLQFTSTKTSTPVLSPQNATSLSTDSAQPVAGASSLRPGFQEETERRLSAILAQIEGVGNVHVMVSLSTGPRLQIAQDINGDKTVTEETDKQGGKRRIVSERWNEKVVIVREGQGAQDKPVVLVEHRPVIAGVLVVADGATDSAIKLRIGRAVQTAIDIPAHRVTVVARKK